MLCAECLQQLQFGKLMEVYEASNRENARKNYPRMDKNAALFRVEQDFYTYLSECFFQSSGAYYCVLEEGTRYVSAFRVEHYLDGVLLEALETVEDLRNRGYGKRLLREFLSGVQVPVYSHVKKDNASSLRVHKMCGFTTLSNTATFIDGTYDENSFTLVKLPG